METIIARNTLSDAEKAEILALEACAFAPDGLENHAFLTSEINFDPALACFYLYREGGELTGFLTTFMPTRAEAEISAVTAPGAQRRGIFTALLAAAKQTLKKAGVPSLLYCVEPKSRAACAVLHTLGVSALSHSEYRMELSRQNAPPAPAAALRDGSRLRLIQATPALREPFTRITQEAFGRDEDAASTEVALTSDERRGWLLYRGDTPVGVFVLAREDKVFLYGVAVAAAERGKGYGRILLQNALALGFLHGDVICLDVDSHNPVAFSLYKSCGFAVTFQVDYYRTAL